jgi:hypothetical protein
MPKAIVATQPFSSRLGACAMSPLGTSMARSNALNPSPCAAQIAWAGPRPAAKPSRAARIASAEPARPHVALACRREHADEGSIRDRVALALNGPDPGDNLVEPAEAMVQAAVQALARAGRGQDGHGRDQLPHVVERR